MVAAAWFVLVFLVEGWLRPGYSPVSRFVSELSIGPRGWIQITSFLLTGTLVVLFGLGLRAALRGGPAGGAGPVLLYLIGAGLFASGPFVTDPSTMIDQHTPHGTVHQLFGAVVFSLAPASCFVLYRRFRRDPAWRSLSRWTLGAGVALVVEIVLLRVAQLPDGVLFDDKGLVQRALLVTFLGWLFAVGARLWSVAGRPEVGTGAVPPAA